MKLILLLVGSCFREGSQSSNLIDTDQSYIAQKNASDSHNSLINYLNDNNIDVDIVINTHNTKYEKDIKMWYGNNLVQFIINDQLIGLETLVNNALNKFSDYYYDNYDAILILRLDLFLKNDFFSKFNPFSDKILFPFICWKLAYIYKNYPRVADTLMFIPKNYFYLIQQKIFMSHEAWFLYKSNYNLSSDNIGFIINTFHDSDSEKDYNPLYYIVSRDESKIWYSGDKLYFDPNINLEQYINIQSDSIHISHDTYVYNNLNKPNVTQNKIHKLNKLGKTQNIINLMQKYSLKNTQKNQEQNNQQQNNQQQNNQLQNNQQYNNQQKQNIILMTKKFQQKNNQQQNIQQNILQTIQQNTQQNIEKNIQIQNIEKNFQLQNVQLQKFQLKNTQQNIIGMRSIKQNNDQYNIKQNNDQYNDQYIIDQYNDQYNNDHYNDQYNTDNYNIRQNNIQLQNNIKQHNIQLLQNIQHSKNIQQIQSIQLNTKYFVNKNN